MPLQAAFNFAHFSIKVHSVVTTNFRESKEKRNRFNPIIEVHSIVTRETFGARTLPALFQSSYRGAIDCYLVILERLLL